MSTPPQDEKTRSAVVRAGIPALNSALYHRMRFVAGDPAALIEVKGAGEPGATTLIIRDIEMDRARAHARADKVCCPGDFAPAGGLSGDREIATAQSVAEFLKREGVERVVADRSLPLIFAHEIERAGVDLECDPEMGVLERRAKDEQELAWLRDAQGVTEEAIRLACEMVASAEAGPGGVLRRDGAPLTSERVRAAIDVFLLERGYANPPSIVAGGPQGADCHSSGSGELRTGEPVIIDVFPRNRETLYNGDCTRTVVHGDFSGEIARMHAAVVAAKAASIASVRAGVTGEDVHAATAKVITDHGYSMGLPPDGAPDSYCGMVHGTGHGVGLEVHEPPLLDRGGPVLVAGDVLTVEPGLYCKDIGGIRVEDMVAVTPSGCDNFDALPESLTWR